MTPEQLIARIKQGEQVTFKETLKVVEDHFVYTPVGFTNGQGQRPVVNPPGKNEGSCKIFALGKRYHLSPKETLALFGELYWKDVLENPDGTDHANIRTFMREGWEGIRFDADPLEPKP